MNYGEIFGVLFLGADSKVGIWRVAWSLVLSPATLCPSGSILKHEPPQPRWRGAFVPTMATCLGATQDFGAQAL